MKKIATIALSIFSVFVFSCSTNDISSGGTVKYEVTSSKSGFFITYENSSGNTEQQDISSSSWTQSFEGESGAFVYISAQTNNESATITSKIYYKGTVIEQATSTGDYVIATASGSLP